MAKPKLVKQAETGAPSPDNPEQDISKQTLDQGQEGSALDPFNVEAMRLPPSFVEKAAVKKVLGIVPVRKPTDQEWFRVHSDPDYRGNFACIKLKAENEYYIVTPNVAVEIKDEIISVIIYTAVTKTGTVFLWPVKVPVAGTQGQTWHESAHECAEVAMERWIRIKANREIGGYERSLSDNPAITEPKFPELTFNDLLKLGFAKTGRYVTNFEHPVIKALLG